MFDLVVQSITAGFEKHKKHIQPLKPNNLPHI